MGVLVVMAIALLLGGWEDLVGLELGHPAGGVLAPALGLLTDPGLV